MSGPSATAKPRSPKIAVISSITWLIGWMRPRSAGDWRTGSVTSTFSAASRTAIAASRSSALRRASASVTRFLRPLIAGPIDLALVRAHGAQASSASPRPSPSCRARRRAPPPAPARRRPGRRRPSGRLPARQVIALFVNGEIHVHLRLAVEPSLCGLSGSDNRKPAPALPARVSQIRLSKAWEALA